MISIPIRKMGEEEKKPKVEGKPQKPGWKRTHSRTGAEKREKYRAPTPGLEDDVFAVGTAQDAANFEEVRRRLGRYVAVNFKNGGAMAQTAIERLEEPVIEEPEDLPDAASRMQEKKWEIEYDKYHKQLNAWDDARKRAYQLLLLHCHPQVEEKLDAVEGFQAINEQQDLIKLLQTIRSIVHKHDEVKGGTMAIVEQDLRLFLGFQ